MVSPVVAFATFQIKTIVPVKLRDLSDYVFFFKQRAARCTNTHEATVCGGVSQRACSTAGALALFCFCSGFWKECVSNMDGPCQRPLDDASSYTTAPRCLASFTNTLSSLFGALLVWHHAGHVHQSTEMSIGFYYKMWESQNLQIWAPLQSLRAEQCHGRAYVK